MRPFRFRLARVLRVRTVEEEIARTEWSVVEQTAKQARDAAASTRARLTQTLDETRRLQLQSPIRPEEILLQHSAAEGLRRGLASELRRVSLLEREAERLREGWELARREKKAAVKLRERAHADHLNDATRLENREADETAITRAAREQRVASRELAP